MDRRFLTAAAEAYACAARTAWPGPALPGDLTSTLQISPADPRYGARDALHPTGGMAQTRITAASGTDASTKKTGANALGQAPHAIATARLLCPWNDRGASCLAICRTTAERSREMKPKMVGQR